MPRTSPSPHRCALVLFWIALGLAVGVGVLGRGYWTPDEPREADIAWRMSWQPDKAVPLLAGDAFCEKPPLVYWVSAAAIRVFGDAAWAARLPNLLYAMITALAMGALARRGAGPLAGLVAAGALSTLLLSYQVAIWLATDAPLLATTTVALLGLYLGFYAQGRGARVRAYSCMHAALALGFLSKSAAAWMVPVLTLVTLVIWEKRWRELLRWELYVGVFIQAALIGTWVWLVYIGPQGSAHLKVFFWNNLVGRFTQVNAPEELQYATAHRNSPGKYFVELPIYLWPWTLLVLAAVRTAWRERGAAFETLRPVRFALAAVLPTLGFLSVAATARNIYLAPALPGVALLLGWWAARPPTQHDGWDRGALRATAGLLGLAVIAMTGAAVIVGRDAERAGSVGAAIFSTAGLGCGAILAIAAWRAAGRARLVRGLFAALLAYCVLLIGPAAQVYRGVDAWQNLASIGRALGRDGAGRPLILFAPDETTRAFVDMYARTSVELVPGPSLPASLDRLDALLARVPGSLVLVQVPGRNASRTVREVTRRLGLEHVADPALAVPLPAWAAPLGLHFVRIYTVPNGRRYGLLAATAAVP